VGLAERNQVTGCPVIVVVSHMVDDYLADLMTDSRYFCPGKWVAWFDSGPADRRQECDLERIPISRPMDYVRITAAFLDVFEWFAGTDSGYLVNVEMDAALVAPGYLSKVEYWLRDVFHQNHGHVNDARRRLDHTRAKADGDARNSAYLLDKHGLAAIPRW
jgi:hypothetical protein